MASIIDNNSVYDLCRVFEQVQISQPRRASILGTIAEYLPVRAVDPCFAILHHIFQEPVSLTAETQAFKGRELTRLSVEIEQWERKVLKLGRLSQFRPSAAIINGLKTVRNLRPLAPFFLNPALTMSLHARVSHVVIFCPEARIMSLSHTQVDAQVLAPLLKLKKLRKLSLHDTNITPELLESFVHCLKRLTSLDVDNCPGLNRPVALTLFHALPKLRQLRFEGSNDACPWRVLTARATSIPHHAAFGYLPPAFFDTGLGALAVSFASTYALFRDASISGKEHLLERIKNWFGHCKGHSYAFFISQLTGKPIDPTHIQFFQALEYLRHNCSDTPNPSAESYTETINQLIPQYIDILADKPKGITHTRFSLDCTSNIFWEEFNMRIGDPKLQMVELALNPQEGEAGHSIAVTLKPHLMVADIQHGIGQYKVFQALFDDIVGYINRFSTVENPLSTISGLAFLEV